MVKSIISAFCFVCAFILLLFSTVSFIEMGSGLWGIFVGVILWLIGKILYNCGE